MNRMALVALAASAVLALAGCTGAASSEAVASSGAASSEAVASSEAASSEVASSGAVAWDEAGLRKALAQCVTYGPGEAGVSLKTAIAAAGLLDWAEDAGAASLDADQLNAVVADWFAGQTADAQALLRENWESLDGQAQAIAADPVAAADLLESAGNPQTHTSYTLANYTALQTAVAAQVA